MDLMQSKPKYNRTGVISGRLAIQLVLFTVVAVFLVTYSLLNVDINPFATQHEPQNHERELKAPQHVELLNHESVQKGNDPNSVMVSFDEIMKGPVALQQDDPRLIQRIREQYVHAPSSEPYALSKDNDDPSMGQSKEIRKIFGEKEGGFFIECGALDGETRSNTLVFEKKYNWKGILIEGDPKNFQLVQTKNRKAWAVDACLSTLPYPNTVMFKQQFNIGKISSAKVGHHMHGYAEVQCLPIFSILLALNVTTVDYFSLDVEGVELEVLKTIPWDKVDIKTLSVEFIHGKDGKRGLYNYMRDQGYEGYSEVTHPGSLANDIIFIKNGLTPVVSATHNGQNT